MKNLQDPWSDLAPLQTFDPAAFKADKSKDIPESLCNLVLSLALIFNDCKDLTYAYFTLDELRPEGTFRKNRVWGSFTGIQFHITRLYIGHLHELFNIIEKNQPVLGHPFFVKVLKNINSQARNSWQALVDVALGKTPTDTFGDSLFDIRNKVAFHYDPKEILKGFNQHFFSADGKGNRAFISRGSNMMETRFYFADAAVQGYLVGLDFNKPEFSKNMVEIMKAVNFALMGIIVGFIQKRNFPFRDETE